MAAGTDDSKMKQVFSSFSGGSLLMGSGSFAKLARECDVVNGKCSIGDCDMIFASVKDGPSFRKITFDEFKKAILLCAGRRGQNYDELDKAIVASWTSKQEGQQQKPNSPRASTVPASRPTTERERLRAEGFKNLTALGTVVRTVSAHLEKVFNHYCSGKQDMDAKAFAKFAKECQLTAGKRACSRADVDVIFAKALSKAQSNKPSRRIGFQQWLDAIAFAASKRGEETEETENSILAAAANLIPLVSDAEEALEHASTEPADKIPEPSAQSGPARSPFAATSVLFTFAPPSPRTPKGRQSRFSSPRFVPPHTASSAPRPSHGKFFGDSNGSPTQAPADPDSISSAHRPAAARQLFDSPPDAAASGSDSPDYPIPGSSAGNENLPPTPNDFDRQGHRSQADHVPHSPSRSKRPASHRTPRRSPSSRQSLRPSTAGRPATADAPPYRTRQPILAPVDFHAQAVSLLRAATQHSADVAGSASPATARMAGPSRSRIRSDAETPPRSRSVTPEALSRQRPATAPRPFRTGGGVTSPSPRLATSAGLTPSRRPSPSKRKWPAATLPLPLSVNDLRGQPAHPEAATLLQAAKGHSGAHGGSRSSVGEGASTEVATAKRQPPSTARDAPPRGGSAAGSGVGGAGGAPLLSPLRSAAAPRSSLAGQLDPDAAALLQLRLRAALEELRSGGPQQALTAAAVAAVAKAFALLAPGCAVGEVQAAMAAARVAPDPRMLSLPRFAALLASLAASPARRRVAAGGEARLSDLRIRMAPRPPGGDKHAALASVPAEIIFESGSPEARASPATPPGHPPLPNEEESGGVEQDEKDDAGKDHGGEQEGGNGGADADNGGERAGRRTVAWSVTSPPKVAVREVATHPGGEPPRSSEAPVAALADRPTSSSSAAPSDSAAPERTALEPDEAPHGHGSASEAHGEEKSDTDGEPAAGSRALPGAPAQGKLWMLRRSRSSASRIAAGAASSEGERAALPSAGQGARAWATSMRNLHARPEPAAGDKGVAAREQGPGTTSGLPGGPDVGPEAAGGGERVGRTLQFADDGKFAVFHSKIRAARTRYEMQRKAALVGAAAAEWVLMPGETAPDEQRDMYRKNLLPPAWLVDEAVRQVKRVLRWSFSTVEEAFAFFDIGRHMRLSLPHFQRGFYRLNIHELWRCPHRDCARWTCALDVDAAAHCYILLDERMCLSMMRAAHVVDNSFLKHDFERFFAFAPDPALERPTTCVDVVSTSAQTPTMLRRLTARALAGGRLAQAALKLHRTIDGGRDFGIREDWKRYARWLGGGNAWRLLHQQLAQLNAQMDRRKAVFDQTCTLLKDMAWNEADPARHRNTAQVERLERQLERHTRLVKKKENRVLSTLERYSLHLVLPKAVQQLNGGREPVALEPDLSNLLAVFLDLMEALVLLSSEQLQNLLLPGDNPEGNISLEAEDPDLVSASDEHSLLSGDGDSDEDGIESEHKPEEDDPDHHHAPSSAGEPATE